MHAARHGWDVEKDAPLFRNWAIHTGIDPCLDCLHVVEFSFHYTNLLAYDLMKRALKSCDLSPGTFRGCMRRIDDVTQQ